jgi:hypothetical protein
MGAALSRTRRTEALGDLAERGAAADVSLKEFSVKYMEDDRNRQVRLENAQLQAALDNSAESRANIRNMEVQNKRAEQTQRLQLIQIARSEYNDALARHDNSPVMASIEVFGAPLAGRPTSNDFYDMALRDAAFAESGKAPPATGEQRVFRAMEAFGMNITDPNMEKMAGDIVATFAAPDPRGGHVRSITDRAQEMYDRAVFQEKNDPEFKKEDLAEVAHLLSAYTNGAWAVPAKERGLMRRMISAARIDWDDFFRTDELTAGGMIHATRGGTEAPPTMGTVELPPSAGRTSGERAASETAPYIPPELLAETVRNLVPPGRIEGPAPPERPQVHRLERAPTRDDVRQAATKLRQQLALMERQGTATPANTAPIRAALIRMDRFAAFGVRPKK